MARYQLDTRPNELYDHLLSTVVIAIMAAALTVELKCLAWLAHYLFD
jgi:hypothetical protein